MRSVLLLQVFLHDEMHPKAFFIAAYCSVCTTGGGQEVDEPSTYSFVNLSAQK